MAQTEGKERRVDEKRSGKTYSKKHHVSDFVPPHLVLEFSRLSPEPGGLSLQPVGLVHQQLDLLSPVQHLLNVLDHHVLHLCDLALDFVDGVRVGVGAKVFHLLSEHSRKLGVVRVGQGRARGGSVLRRETVLYVFQKRKRNSSAETLVGHGEVDDAVVAQDMVQVTVLGIGDAAVHKSKEERKEKKESRSLWLVTRHPMPCNKTKQNKNEVDLCALGRQQKKTRKLERKKKKKKKKERERKTKLTCWRWTSFR